MSLTVAVLILAGVVMTCSIAVVYVLEDIRNALRSNGAEEET